MSELYIPAERPTRNPTNGRFLKGIPPHNKGSKMRYHSVDSKERGVRNLLKGRGGHHRTGAGMNKKSVVALTNGKLCGVFPSIQAAGMKVGVSPSAISNVCNKKLGHHTVAGFQWFFENDKEWLTLIY